MTTLLVGSKCQHGFFKPLKEVATFNKDIIVKGENNYTDIQHATYT
jgi:hypothetical protein